MMVAQPLLAFKSTFRVTFLAIERIRLAPHCGTVVQVFLLRTALDGQVAEPGALVGFKARGCAISTPRAPS